MRRISTILVVCTAIAASGASESSAQTPPASPVIDPALAAHVSAAGLQAIGEGIAAVMPTGIEVTGLEGEFDCDEEEEGVLEYAVAPLTVNISTDDVSITPTEGRLDINLDMTVWSDEVSVTAVGPCLFELNESCTFELAPTALNADIAVLLDLQDGQLTASVDSFSFTHGNFGNPIDTGCVLGDALETLGGYGIDLIGGVLDDVLDSQLGELETQLDEMLGGLAQSLALSDSLDILGSTLVYDVAASTLAIDDTGLKLGFTANFSTDAYGPCVPESGPFIPSAHDMPPMTGLIPDTVAPYHLAVVASEDLLNEALYVAWQAGVLCLSLGELSPIPLDTQTLLGSDIPDIVEETWPEPLVLDIRIGADAPPIAVFEGGPRIEADLNVDVYGDELDRLTRHWGHGMLMEAGVDLEITDGEFILDIGFDLETSLGISVSYNEWLPSAIPEQFAANLPGLISAGLSTQGLDLEAGLVPPFPMPGFNGLTLTDLDMRVVGGEDDYLGVYGWIDPTQVTAMQIGPIDMGGIGCGDTGGGGDIVIPGCEDGLGCGDTGGGCGGEEGGCAGCGGGEEGGCGGCSTSRSAAPRVLLLWMLPVLIASRRRRS